jgi:endonuclease/exonuclease/phosphatase family metal-dependent hydrolase
MRIATFNVDSLDHAPHAPVPLEERLPILRPQLERLRADILCLQEVNAQHRGGHGPRELIALDRLLEGTRYETYERAASVPRSGAGYADVHNLVTLSRWPMVKVRSVRNAIVPPLGYRPLTAQPASEKPEEVWFERPILLADIAVSEGRIITVINVHFRAPTAAPIAGQKESAHVWKSVAGWAEGYTLSAWKRAAQALETRLIIDKVLDGDENRIIVVAGDFNAEDHETPLKIVSGAEEDTGNGLLAQRSLAVLDRTLSSDRRFSVIHHGRPMMLDHILASRPALAFLRSFEVQNEMLADELISYGRIRHEPGSPHAPVVAEFELP